MNCLLTFFPISFPFDYAVAQNCFVMYTFKIITIVFLKMNKQANNSFLTFAGDIQRIL